MIHDNSRLANTSWPAAREFTAGQCLMASSARLAGGMALEVFFGLYVSTPRWRGTDQVGSRGAELALVGSSWL